MLFHRAINIYFGGRVNPKVVVYLRRIGCLSSSFAQLLAQEKVLFRAAEQIRREEVLCSTPKSSLSLSLSALSVGEDGDGDGDVFVAKFTRKARGKGFAWRSVTVSFLT